MGTRSIIAATNLDHTISAIYCHWDGYLSGVGKLLLDHYTNPDDITRLMGLGDLSWLGDKPEDPGDLWERENCSMPSTVRTGARRSTSIGMTCPNTASHTPPTHASIRSACSPSLCRRPSSTKQSTTPS